MPNVDEIVLRLFRLRVDLANLRFLRLGTVALAPAQVDTLDRACRAWGLSDDERRLVLGRDGERLEVAG